MSADDIASLFAAVKPQSAPVNRKNDIADLDQMSDTASADEIADLFKSVQAEKKVSAPEKPRSNAAAENRFAREIEDLSETTTSEDIAELFKSVKSGLAEQRVLHRSRKCQVLSRRRPQRLQLRTWMRVLRQTILLSYSRWSDKSPTRKSTLLESQRKRRC